MRTKKQTTVFKKIESIQFFVFFEWFEFLYISVTALSSGRAVIQIYVYIYTYINIVSVMAVTISSGFSFLFFISHSNKKTDYRIQKNLIHLKVLNGLNF